MENKTLLIIAGGTGGHVMPALAIASELITRGVKVHWMGTQSGMEAKWVKAYSIPMSTIEIQSIRGKGFFRWVQAPFQILKAIIQSVKIIRKLKPDGVLSTGGYVSGPGSIAAWLCRCPLIIHEQNAAPGLTNRLLAPIASLILTGFPNLFSNQAKKTKYTGNPVRLNIMNLPTKEQNKNRSIRLLIVGGSLGASILNQTLPGALGALEPDLRPEVWHQTGAGQLEETQRAYQQQGIAAIVAPFIDDMSAAYAWADCVICRAGALTIAELAASGSASILIPFPLAADNHQMKNAKYLTEQGAALLLPQSELSSAKLTQLLADYFQDVDKLRAQGAKALSLAKPHATLDVVTHLLNTI